VPSSSSSPQAAPESAPMSSRAVSVPFNFFILAVSLA
jgi:hypothetical protein